MASPRTFRLEPLLLEDLQAEARASGVSVNALAARLLDEGIRRERHPLIFFRRGAAGRRAALIGTRLDVDKVVDTLRNSDGSVEAAAEYLGIPEPSVRACLRYYAEYRDEVDEWARLGREFAEREEALWRAERSCLAMLQRQA